MPPEPPTIPSALTDNPAMDVIRWVFLDDIWRGIFLISSLILLLLAAIGWSLGWSVIMARITHKPMNLLIRLSRRAKTIPAKEGKGNVIEAGGVQKEVLPRSSFFLWGLPWYITYGDGIWTIPPEIASACSEIASAGGNRDTFTEVTQRSPLTGNVIGVRIIHPMSHIPLFYRTWEEFEADRQLEIDHRKEEIEQLVDEYTEIITEAEAADNLKDADRFKKKAEKLMDKKIAPKKKELKLIEDTEPESQFTIMPKTIRVQDMARFFFDRNSATAAEKFALERELDMRNRLTGYGHIAWESLKFLGVILAAVLIAKLILDDPSGASNTNAPPGIPGAGVNM